MSNVCTCGHVQEEHDTTSFAPCTIDGCGCVAYEEENEDNARDWDAGDYDNGED